MRPRIEQLLSAKQLAARSGVSKRTMQRRILAWLREPGCDWVVRDGAALKVNLSRLRRAKPGMFSVQAATKAEVEEIREEVVQLKESHGELRARQNALAAAVRSIRAGRSSKDGQ